MEIKVLVVQPDNSCTVETREAPDDWLDSSSEAAQDAK